MRIWGDGGVKTKYIGSEWSINVLSKMTDPFSEVGLLNLVQYVYLYVGQVSVSLI